MDTPDVPMKLLVEIAAGESKMVPLDAGELAQREVDQAAAVEMLQSAKAIEDERDLLIAKLAAGKATPEEVQQALAQMLGGAA